MTVQHGLKTIVFAILGFAFGQWMGFILAMTLAGLVGTLLGKSLLNRIDERRFRLALDAVLILLSLRLIYAGGMELWGG
jgi:uncharacterized protein